MAEDFEKEENQFRFSGEEDSGSESYSKYSYPDNKNSDTPITDSLRGKKETRTNQPFIFQKSPELQEIDRELEELLKKQTSSVKVYGIGGAGGNTISRMREIGIKGGQFITVNTDAQDLLYSNADHKILIGRELTMGLGAGSNPKIGEEAAHESEQDIKKSLSGADMVFVTCGLGGGCLRGSSLVYTNPKGPVRIDSIKPEDTVYTFSNGELVKKKVLAAMKTGIKKVLELKTKNRTIYASYDHPFLKVKPLNNLSNDRFSEFDVEWTELEDLKKGDLVVVLKELTEDGKPLELPNGFSDKDFCQIFGFLLGDGWLSKSEDSWKIHFSPSLNNKLNEKYINLFKKAFNLEMKKTKSANWYYANSKKVYELLERLGLHKRANEKEIPQWVFSLPKEQKKAFIIGLADADGSYSIQIGKTGLPKKEIKFEMSSENLIKQLKVLCDSIGLRTSNVSSRTRIIKAPNSKEAKKLTSWTVRIYKTQQLLGELVHSKARNGPNFMYKFRSREIPDFFKNFGFNRVESICDIGEEEVYDITVDGSHNFISEGFVVHNTGTGAAPIIAGLAKKQGALTIGVVTLPFSIEGRKRIENAEYGLERMESVVDTLIIIPNDKLLEIAPELPLQTAFRVADEILTNAVKGITELVTKAGLVNLDFADVKAVMCNGGVSLIGMGEADSQNRAKEAVEKALVNPLLDVDLTNATGALINIIGGQDMSLDEAREIIACVGERLSPDAKMIWGAQISPEMEKSIRVMIIVTGVHSAQITGGELPPEIQKQMEISDELGIEFLE
jgi:cell division protein FtsZ